MAQKNEVDFWTIMYFLGFLAYTKSLGILTRYFPFSEFWQDKNFHYKNRFLSEVYETLSIAGYETHKYDFDQYYVRVHFLTKKSAYTNKIVPFKRIIKILEEKFQTRANICIRKEGTKNQYNLQIPTSYIFPESIISV